MEKTFFQEIKSITAEEMLEAKKEREKTIKGRCLKFQKTWDVFLTEIIKSLTKIFK